jgi:ribulose-bisphosphate carboxylase small chain
MHLTQGTFSFLPPLTDEQIARQIRYALDCGWPISLEYTDDPHPRNSYWELYGLPMFDLHDVNGVMAKLADARRENPNAYIKLNAYDARLGRQTTALSFIVQRPLREPGFRLDRQEQSDRRIGYTLHAYAADEPHGVRYRTESGPAGG